MFTLGTFDAGAATGLTAILESWIGLPGLAVETVDVPGIDGAFYGASTLGKGSWTFELTATAATPADVLTLAGAVSAACAPEHQVQQLTLAVAPGWVWYAAASAPLAWERHEWDPGARCTLVAKLELTCPDPYGYASPDETAIGASSATIVRTKGTASSFPRIEVTGTFSAVHLVIGGVPLGVTTPLAAGQALVLDYQRMDFGVWAGVTKVRQAAQGMSHFRRYTLPIGSTLVTATATGGAVTSVTVLANSRRA